MGGIIAANSNGFWRARYGGVRDLLIGTRTALADGTVARAGGRVVKNVAGYDLDKLLVGSFGTLGVIAEATLKVLPLPETSDGLVAGFGRSTEAFAVANTVVRAASRVEACVVERSEDGPWTLAVQARGSDPTVKRALRDARREVAAGVAQGDRPGVSGREPRQIQVPAGLHFQYRSPPLDVPADQFPFKMDARGIKIVSSQIRRLGQQLQHTIS